MLGLAHGPHSPRAVSRAPPAIRSRLKRFGTDRDRTCPVARLRETGCVDKYSTMLANILPRLQECGDGALPGEIARETVLGRFEDEPHSFESFDDFDPKRTHARVHPIAEHTGGAHDMMLALA